MKPFLGFIFTLFLAVVLSPAAPFPTAQAINYVPEGLTPADWAAIQSFLPSDYLKASNTGAEDFFGYAVAVSGDTVVVGAHREDSNATGVNGDQADNSASFAGAAYVFVRTAGVWSQQAYLKASNTGAVDQFGYAVAVSGDTIVVGAHGEDSHATGVNGDQADNSATDSGAAYVFTRTAGVWSQQAYLKASNTGAVDQFGYAVAVSGDTVVVGAYFEDSNATGVNGDQANNSTTDSGAAYLFTRTGGVWSQQAYLKASNTGAGDRFGTAIAIDDDTIVVGAPYEDSNATGVDGEQTNNLSIDAGAVYVFTRTAGVWSQQAYLKASNTGEGDYFGIAVAVSGDTVVVGAYWEASNATGVNGNQANNSAVDSGAAYVFTRTGGVWSQQAYLKASNTGTDDEFGRAVAVSGDTVMVGAWGEDSHATGVNGDQANNLASDSGAAYVFTRAGGVWSQQAYLKASNTDANDFFGIAVGVSGDTVLVGADREDSAATGVNGDQANNSATDSGAVYAFLAGQELSVGVVGAGQVASEPVGIDCGAVCTAAFALNTAVTLTATAGTESVFMGWSGDISSTTNPITVTMDSAKNIMATFALNEYELTTATAGNGVGLVSPAGGTYPYGTVITLTATAETGSIFTDWSGDVNSTANPITVTMDSAKNITATFALNEYELTTSTAGNGAGTVSPASGTYPYGTVITLTATADTGSTFTGWSGDVSSTTNPITLTMDSAKTITATFALNEYTIAVSAEPAEGGTVTGGGEVTHGQVVTVTATTGSGYTFVNWTEDGDVVSSEANYSFTVTAGRTLVAHFAAIPPSLPKIYLPLILR